MKHLLIYLLLFLSANLFSQKIKTIKDPTSDLIHEKRDSLTLMLKNKNGADFLKVFESLKKIEIEHYVVLFPVERCLIDYCIEGYYDIIVNFSTYDSLYFASLKHKILPQPDSLGFVLINYVRQNIKIIDNQINASSLNQDKIDLLKLNLLNCILDPYHPVISQDILNSHAKKFIHDYPDSRFNSFIEDNILNEIVPSKLGLSLDLELGVGNYTKSLSNYFGQNGFGSFGLELSYKKLDFIFRLKGGSSIVQKDFIVDNILWQTKIHPDVSLPELSMGYYVLDYKHLRVIPSGGISFLKLAPSYKDKQQYPDIKGSSIKMPMYTMGLTCDFKYRLHKFDTYYGSHNYNVGFIRLRYTISIPNDNYNGNIGNMSSLTIGWGITLRGVQFVRK